jgi:hypothetical protein
VAIVNDAVRAYELVIAFDAVLANLENDDVTASYAQLDVGT